MNINKILVLDAMGVIYQSCDDVEELLVPFIREQGSSIDRKAIEDLYTRASLGEFSSEEFWAKVGVDYNLEDEYLDRHQLSVGLSDFLSVFKNQVKAPIYCLSNDVSEWSIKLRKKFQLDQYIERWFISGDLKIRKPSPVIYDVLIRDANVKPTQILFVDDREKNIAKANEFGIQTVLCKINNSTEEYNDEGESKVIYSFSELLDHFSKS
ncbi:MAG: HAD-IA family hydrolase [Gemmatimonadetes bacterium]|nr:HAD-IA family hydrolase [Gemmatimonadota bacterium]